MATFNGKTVERTAENRQVLNAWNVGTAVLAVDAASLAENVILFGAVREAVWTANDAAFACLSDACLAAGLYARGIVFLTPRCVGWGQ